MTSPTITYSDDFSGSGSLDGSPVGASSIDWAALAGTWSRSNGVAACTDAPSTSPMLVADFGHADVTLSVGVYTGFAGGDALYFRVSDAANWWRLRCRAYQTTGSYQQTTYTYGPWTLSSTFTGAYFTGIQYSDYVGGQPTRQEYVTTANGANSTIEVDTRTATPTTSTVYYTNNYRQLILEKCVAGAVTQVGSWQVSAFGKLAVSTNGSSITYYEPDGTTVHASTTDSFNSTATKHGIGKGGNDSVSYSSALDNFALSFLGSTTPPSITSPANGADVDIDQPVVLTVVSNYGTADPLTSADIQWRAAGATDWTVVTGALSAPGDWTLDTTGLSAPVQIEAQVRGTDSHGNTSAWSPSVFFTLRARPTAPAFIAPAAGATVVAAAIATIDFGTDSTARDARRLGDLDGNPDPETVYQDPLTLTGPDTDGYYEATGDGSIHPTGPEHVQARRQTSAGGSLWSEWVDVAVTMQLASPYPVTVGVVSLAADGANQFDLTPAATDETHPAATRLDCYRDGVRVASLGVTGTDTVTWVDRLAPKQADYRFVAVSDNGGTTTTG